VATNSSDLATVASMAKTTPNAVNIHARLRESDVAEIDSAAHEELITRSGMIARIVREWVKQRSPQKHHGGKAK
jgi:metal-responsive CopG/Arc/MetJ family transcriptional regulator